MFLPAPGGYSALYCSSRCKRTKRAPKKVNGDSYYVRVIKKDPDKLREHRAATNQHRKEAREWLANYKITNGCIDCGFNKHPAALQLDHNGPKTASISELRTSIKRMQLEILNGNCVVRCANCHAVKTSDTRRTRGY